jgi:hypothetical protein
VSIQEDPSVANARAAAATAKFNSIRIDHGPQNALISGLDGFRLQAIALREQRAATGEPLPMPVACTIAELGVGKTIGAQRLERMHRPTDPHDIRRPVIIATLDTTGQQISIPQAILIALKKRNATHASKPSIAWERAFKALREHDVQLVIFDEMNRAARRPTMGAVIGGDLMDMLQIGNAAVAFLGTTEAKMVFNRVPALKDRMKSPVVMKPLEWYDAEERAIFVEFLENMDEAMLDCGIVTAAAELGDYVGKRLDQLSPTGDASSEELSEHSIVNHETDDDDVEFYDRDVGNDGGNDGDGDGASAGDDQDDDDLADTKDTAKLLWEVCRGRLRPLCLLLEEAVRLIHFDNDKLVIMHDVLAQAVENHSRENEIISYNPFLGENPA